MEELVPILLGGIYGAAIWRHTRGAVRIGISAVAASAATATLISGEFRESWLSLLLDAGLSALGLAAGFLLIHSWPRLADSLGWLARNRQQGQG